MNKIKCSDEFQAFLDEEGLVPTVSSQRERTPPYVGGLCYMMPWTQNDKAGAFTVLEVREIDEHDFIRTRRKVPMWFVRVLLPTPSEEVRRQTIRSANADAHRGNPLNFQETPYIMSSTFCLTGDPDWFMVDDISA